MVDLWANLLKQSKISKFSMHVRFFTRQNTMTKGRLLLINPLKPRKFNNIEGT